MYLLILNIIKKILINLIRNYTKALISFVLMNLIQLIQRLMNNFKEAYISYFNLLFLIEQILV